jgi:hypothetical protein
MAYSNQYHSNLYRNSLPLAALRYNVVSSLRSSEGLSRSDLAIQLGCSSALMASTVKQPLQRKIIEEGHDASSYTQAVREITQL